MTPALISEQRAHLAKGTTVRHKKRSPATVNRYLISLSHVFTMAVREWGWMEQNPVQRVSKLKEPRGRVRFLSDEERDRLIKACRGSSDARLLPLVILAISTGARRGELVGLRPRNLRGGPWRPSGGSGKSLSCVLSAAGVQGQVEGSNRQRTGRERRTGQDRRQGDRRHRAVLVETDRRHGLDRRAGERRRN